MHSKNSEIGLPNVFLKPVDAGVTLINRNAQFDFSYQIQSFDKGSPRWNRLEAPYLIDGPFYQHGLTAKYIYYGLGTDKSKLGFGLGASLQLVPHDWQDQNEIPIDSNAFFYNQSFYPEGNLQYRMSYYDRFVTPVYFTINASLVYRQRLSNRIYLMLSAIYDQGFLKMMRTDFWVTDIPGNTYSEGYMLNRGSSYGGQLKLIYRFRK